MIFWLVVLALVAGYFVRWYLARRARAAFCADEHVTLALRLHPKKRGIGWKHGYARPAGPKLEWRAEFKLKPGADLTFELNDLHVREHRPVRPRETMLSEQCELIFAIYRGEEIELGIPRDELPTLLGWLRAA